MSKHTPGPWFVVADERYDPFFCADKIVGYDVKSSTVEIVGSEGISGDSELNIANANLISAAPDLLEALEEAISMIGSPLIKDTFVYDWHEKATAAIAKARGEA